MFKNLETDSSNSCTVCLYSFFLLDIFRCNGLGCTDDTMWWGLKVHPLSNPGLPRVRKLYCAQNFMSKS